MSWQTDIENKVFTIKTGDGNTYSPKWRVAVKVIEYNVSIFDFVNTEGSFVDRRKPKGRKFDLEFYFDGATAVTTGNLFEVSARDPRPWTIQHPFYGQIICQPISLHQDNNDLNCTKFHCPVIETLQDALPSATVQVADKMTELQATANLNQRTTMANTGVNKGALTTTVKNLDNTYSRAMSKDSELATFKKQITTATNAINAPLFSAIDTIREIQSVINLPATISQSITDRLNIFNESLTGLFQSLNGTLISKRQIESMGASVITAMHIAAINPQPGNYKRRSDISTIQDSLLAAYQRYLLFLDSMITDRADNITSYQPDFASLNTLDEMVNLSLANLFQLMFSAKQERRHVCEKDTNPIELTSQLYGLDIDDKNLNAFLEENSIGIDEILNILKGREVFHYV